MIREGWVGNRREFISTAAKATAAAALAAGCSPEKDTVVNSADLPFRGVAEAVVACGFRRFFALRERNTLTQSPLEKLLDTQLVESTRIGLVNGQIWEESENLDFGNTQFAIKPWNCLVSTGQERLLLFANSPAAITFRNAVDTIGSLTRLFDRTVWGMHNHRRATAVIETDRYTDKQLEQAVYELARTGVRNFILGNEPNNIATPWITPEAVFQACVITDNTLRRIGIQNPVISLPGMAFYDADSSDLSYFLAFTRMLVKSENTLPFNSIADHYYGPIDDPMHPAVGFLHWLGSRRDALREQGYSHFDYHLTEVGNPAADVYRDSVDDYELARGYIPQILSLSLGSGMVRSVTYHSLFNVMEDKHSLVTVGNGNLVPKDSYRAYTVAAKLLSRLRSIEMNDETDFTVSEGKRTDGMRFAIFWSKRENGMVEFTPPSGALLFDAFGSLLPEKLHKLEPKRKPYLGGPVVIAAY